jgi:hypothetical protein
MAGAMRVGARVAKRDGSQGVVGEAVSHRSQNIRRRRGNQKQVRGVGQMYVAGLPAILLCKQIGNNVPARECLEREWGDKLKCLSGENAGDLVARFG